MCKREFIVILFRFSASTQVRKIEERSSSDHAWTEDQKQQRLMESHFWLFTSSIFATTHARTPREIPIID